MASSQIEFESYEQLDRAEDQQTYEVITRDNEDKSTDQKDNKIVHEVNISWQQWTTIFMLTLIVSIMSACTVLPVCYFTLFAELIVKLEHVEKNYTFLMTKQNTLDDFITAIGVELLRPRECGDLISKKGNGIYTIFSNSSSSSGYEVYCDFETDNGNWTVFQRRINGTTDFYKGWEEYENGFGNLEAEFWLGNKKINELTSNGLHELRVDLTDFEGNIEYAKYSTFFVGNASTQYKLEIDGYSGDLGDSLEYNNGMSFSTKDRDNDIGSSRNCANEKNGAWWYRRCTLVNLNGRYVQGGLIDEKGITWYYWKLSSYSMKSSVMMFRKVYPPG